MKAQLARPGAGSLALRSAAAATAPWLASMIGNRATREALTGPNALIRSPLLPAPRVQLKPSIGRVPSRPRSHPARATGGIYSDRFTLPVQRAVSGHVVDQTRSSDDTGMAVNVIDAGQREGLSDMEVRAAAARGIAGSGGTLPFLDRIQASFGHHDISHVRAHVGGAAMEASRSMNAEAFATGHHVAFGGAPSLHTAAHEAAHVIQQRRGVHLTGGVGAAGDRYEQHADAVADRVVQGQSSEELLDAFAAGGGVDARGASVQQQVLRTGRMKGGRKYYSSLDPDTLFDTQREADEHEQRLERQRNASGPAEAVEAPARPTGSSPAAANAAPAPRQGGRLPDRPLSEVSDSEWAAAWEAKQREVHDAMLQFVPDFEALDPRAEVRIRGSLASGIKGNPKKVDPVTEERLLFNPTDFDIDAYVVSDLLYEQALREQGAKDADLRGQIPGSKHREVNAIIRRMRTALATIPGNRDAPVKDQYHFNVLIRSRRNAGQTVMKDQRAMRQLGKPEDWGDPLVVYRRH